MLLTLQGNAGNTSGSDVGSGQGGLAGQPAYEQINGDDVSEGRPKDGQVSDACFGAVLQHSFGECCTTDGFHTVQPNQDPTSASRKSAEQPPADGVSLWRSENIRAGHHADLRCYCQTKIPEPPLPKAKL